MTDALLAAGPVSTVSLLFARVALGCGLISVLALLALHLLKPDLQPGWHMVSEYALGPHGWVMTLCFSATALGCLSLVVAAVPLRPSLWGWIGLGLLLIAALGLTLGALFPTDPITVAPADASPTAQKHALGVLIGNPPFVIAAVLLSYSLFGAALWDPVRLPLLVAAHLTWIGLLAMIVIAATIMPAQGGFGPNVPIGWPNRVLMLAYGGWIMLAAWPLAWAKAA